jgi:adenine-specific DNA-methyltransferase
MPTPQAPTPQDRFLSLIKRDILKLDAAELDFGIYRILNYRRDQVLAYLDTTLPGHIAEWADALAQTGGRVLAESEAANCYYHLHTFFSRYWDEGDFIPRARRGGSAAYAVPYNGQDTHFHWATKGSHYVKSGEMFSRFAYKDGNQALRFVIQRADTEKDNAKGSAKYFFPAAWQAVDDGFELAWTWRAATDAENRRYKAKGGATAAGPHEAQATGEASAEAIGTGTGATMQERVLDAWLSGSDFKSAKVPKGVNTVLLATNARRFVRKNTSDFFVHPQLGEFLRGELDVYLKHEFVQIWHAPDSELPRIRAKFQLVREHRARPDHLSGPDRTLPGHAVRKAQVRAAGRLPGAMQLVATRRRAPQARSWSHEACANTDQAKPSGQAGWGMPRKNPNGAEAAGAVPAPAACIPAISAPPSRPGCWRAFDDLEARPWCGELVHADNYAALRTLEPAYRERVQCIYIDPPYNTDAGPISYKNDLRDASWLSMVFGRVTSSRSMLGADGVLCVTIDDYELFNLEAALRQIFGKELMAGPIAIRINPSGRPKPDGFATAHEYALFALSTEDAKIARLPRTEEQKRRYKETDKDGSSFMWELFRKRGSNSERTARRKLYYPIYVKDRAARIPELRWVEDLNEWQAVEPNQPDEVVVFPLDDQGIERTWRWKADEARKATDFLKAEKSPEGKWTVYYKYSPEHDGVLATTVWTDSKYSATEHGTGTLKALFASADVFSYPKSVFAVQDCLLVSGIDGENRHFALDFFAGSATTGHAVINLNREDGGDPQVSARRAG